CAWRTWSDHPRLSGPGAVESLAPERSRPPGGPRLQPGARPRVAAVVVTRNRSQVLRETLLAIRRQEWPPASVLVVDNDSDDGTAAMLRAEFPEVGHHRLPENLGFGAPLAAGMRRAAGEDADYFWLLDDDS